MLTGVAIEVPLIAATVWIVARLGIGNAEVGFMAIMRLTAVFAGVAAIFTAGGIGRVAAYAYGETGRRGKAIAVAARTHAIATAGLVLIAAIPHGELEFRELSWLALPGAGLVAGALCGAVIGAVCTSSAVGLADVWSLTMKPSGALRQLLSPADLVRLGSALRTRTSTLFEGIFEPAPPPPQTDAPPTESGPVAASPPAGDGAKKKAV